MTIASEEKVGKYLDDLLIQLEVSKGKDKEVKTKLFNAINLYGKDYNLLEYKTKAYQILNNKPKKTTKQIVYNPIR